VKEIFFIVGSRLYYEIVGIVKNRNAIYLRISELLY